jgi:hypothetical protein
MLALLNIFKTLFQIISMEKMWTIKQWLSCTYGQGLKSIQAQPLPSV